MSLSATIPLAQMEAANAALEEMGFGPGNFSVPVYTGPAPTHATFHAWTDAAFSKAVLSLQEAVELESGTVGPFDIRFSEAEGTPKERVRAALEPIGGKWADDAEELTGVVDPGLKKDRDGNLFWVIQRYDTRIWSDPEAVPALVRRARTPGKAELWRQPRDQFDAYKLKNPLTGLPDQAVYNGDIWEVSVGDAAGNNSWVPGEFGWINLTRAEEPAEPAIEDFVQPTGAHDVYNRGDRVRYNGRIAESLIDNNSWAPGVFGWVFV